MSREYEILITQPSMPDLQSYTEYLEDLWDSKWLTNNGRYSRLLERKLSDRFKVEHCSLYANGTIALMAGLRQLGLKGEVITTPFSFIATANAIKWNQLSPVFCDVEEKYCNMDPDKIESLITPKTSAIMPVHVYGNPCDVKRIEEIASENNLKVIYDAAHAFDTKIDGSSVLNYGDLSVISFHATKVFNTIEGGAIFTNDGYLKRGSDLLRNFGIIKENLIEGLGLNGKMNEFQAAFGLLNLEGIDTEIKKRKKIFDRYANTIRTLEGVRYIPRPEKVDHGYPYFPIFIDESTFGSSRDQLMEEYDKQGIQTRRYFYPLISNTSEYSNILSSRIDNLPVSNRKSDQVLCLPIHGALSEESQDRVMDVLIDQNKG